MTTSTVRILHLLSQLELTGAEVYAQHLIEHQVTEGHSVYVISDRIHVPLKTPFFSMPISDNSFFILRKNQERLHAFLRDNKIDVIHCHSRAAVRVAHQARHNTNCALVSTIHGRQHASLGKRFSDSYGEYKVLICENLRRQFEVELKSKPGSIIILRNPFDIEKIKARPESSQIKTRITYVGRSSGPKGERFKVLFNEVLAPLLDRNASLQLQIISALPEKFGETFFRTLRPYEHREQVLVIKHQGNLQNVFKTGGLILGAGRIALEALLNNAPVYAIGEHSAPGLVTSQKLSECLKSNFGDIGEASEPEALDVSRAKKEFDQFVALGFRVEPDIVQTLQREYSGTTINHKIIEIYKAAIFKRRTPRGIPILMYHKIPERPLQTKHRIFVEKKNFSKQLETLKVLGFKSLSWQELTEFWHLRRPYEQMPKRPILITFDDGYQDNLSHGLEVLEKYKTRASVFLLADKQIEKNVWDTDTDPTEDSSPLLTPQQRLELASHSLIEVGSHGIDHKKLTGLPPAEVEQEMRSAKSALETELGKKVLAFAYPFGLRPENASDVAEKCGYEFAVNTDQGGLHFADDRYSLFRVNIFPEDGSFAIWKKTSEWYRKRFYRKYGR